MKNKKKLSCSKKSFLLTTLNSITLNCEKKCDECALFAKKNYLFSKNCL